MAENGAAFERVNTLRGNIVLEKTHHTEERDYYESAVKSSSTVVAKLMGRNNWSTGRYNGPWSDTGFGTYSGHDSDVNSPEKPETLAEGGDGGYNAGGKSASPLARSSEGSASADDAAVKALMRQSLAAKVAKLAQDASLRDKVAALLAAKDVDVADPDIAALADALAKAEGSAGVTGGKPDAALLDKARELVANAGKGDGETAGDGFSLTGDESQSEVRRLLASLGGGESAAAREPPVGQSLFVRAHLAHNRNLERGNVLPASRR